MAEREPWSDEEVALTVSDYLAMLADEVGQRSFTKAEHWRALLPRLQGRTKGAIEFKYGNISAALRDLGYPFVDGYKPYSNYQHVVLTEVDAQLRANPELVALIERDVTQPAAVPSIEGKNILATLVERPQLADDETRSLRVRPAWFERTAPSPAKNYLELEAKNRSLGDAGEEFIIAFEQARLIDARQERLAAAVERVSTTRGDGLGFDVLSFEVSGKERLIEVKTTRYSKHTPFFISRNEVRASDLHSDQYSLYRLFHFRDDPKLFILPGPVRTNCRLEAIGFEGRVI